MKPKKDITLDDFPFADLLGGKKKLTEEQKFGLELQKIAKQHKPKNNE